MIRHISAAAGLIAAASTATAVEAADFTTYSSRTAFVAASGPLSSENFNTVKSDVDFAYSSYHASGFTMTLDANDRTPHSAYIDAAPYLGSSIDGTSYAAAAFYSFGDYDSSIVLTFDTPITAFGADFSSGSAGRFIVEVLGNTLTPVVDNPGFFGFVSDTAFTTIRFRGQPQSGHYVTFDNLSFGSGAVAAVPEPSAWAMMIGGFGLIGATQRRRSKIAFG